MSNSLSISRREQAGTVILDLSGELSYGAEAPLLQACEEATQTKPAAILLNFSAVNYINSRGIALLIKILQQAQPTGIKVAACCLKEYFVQILAITRVAEFMPIFPDEASALAGLPGEGGGEPSS
jgi:anti-sigma B factor antagonist